LSKLFDAMPAPRVRAEPAVYHDGFRDDEEF